ncbi:hypothetical protein GGX14DRAFT_570579 [Mycena pura]|uniref:DUF6532 domain-containing protein n=1 Tax=Mycena pura TaxID=153505 RepID=A0AAD6V4R1_9AGAR|nr:hypothetical protein GGX14DRAFT_570579 [Mycena pura]
MACMDITGPPLSNDHSRSEAHSTWTYNYPGLSGALGDCGRPELRRTAPYKDQASTSDVSIAPVDAIPPWSTQDQGLQRSLPPWSTQDQGWQDQGWQDQGLQDQGLQHSPRFLDQGSYLWTTTFDHGSQYASNLDQDSLYASAEQAWQTTPGYMPVETYPDARGGVHESQPYGEATGFFAAEEPQQEHVMQARLGEAPTGPSSALAATTAVDDSSLWGDEPEPATVSPIISLSPSPGPPIYACPSRWMTGGNALVPDSSRLQPYYSQETSSLSSQSNSSCPPSQSNSSRPPSLPAQSSESGSWSRHHSDLDEEDEDEGQDGDRDRDRDGDGNRDADCNIGRKNPHWGLVLQRVKVKIQLSLVNVYQFPDYDEEREELYALLRNERATFRGHARDTMKPIVAECYKLHPDTSQPNQNTGKPWTQAEVVDFQRARAYELGRNYRFLNDESGHFNHPALQQCIRQFLYGPGGLGLRFPGIFDTLSKQAFIFVCVTALRCLDEKAGCPHLFTVNKYSIHYKEIDLLFQGMLELAKSVIEDHTPEYLRKRIESARRVEASLKAWAKPVETKTETDEWDYRGTFAYNWES